MINWAYSFPTGNNGSVASITNNIDTGRTESFIYDAFGNISKSGSMSFQPTYAAATNWMATLPGFTPNYDANGNVENDSLQSYVWVRRRVPVAGTAGLQEPETPKEGRLQLAAGA